MPIKNRSIRMDARSQKWRWRLRQPAECHCTVSMIGIFVLRLSSAPVPRGRIWLLGPDCRYSGEQFRLAFLFSLKDGCMWWALVSLVACLSNSSASDNPLGGAGGEPGKALTWNTKSLRADRARPNSVAVAAAMAVCT
jgi:hypothetical protein